MSYACTTCSVSLAIGYPAIVWSCPAVGQINCPALGDVEFFHFPREAKVSQLQALANFHKDVPAGQVPVYNVHSRQELLSVLCCICEWAPSMRGWWGTCHATCYVISVM